MPSYSPGPNYRTPFRKNEYLGSTADLGHVETYTVAASTVPAVTVDGVAAKVLQPGVVLAKITSGAETGKVGPRDAGASDGRQTVANIVGVNDTFLPWQLNEHDEAVAVRYIGTVVQAWCLEVASGAWIAMTDTSATACIGKKFLNLTFRVLATEELGTDETATGW